MKISYNWLKDYIDHPYEPQELSDILTMLGLEVGGMEEIGGIPGNLEGVVVGKVLECEQHPNADRLRVCKVEVGQAEPLSIVCGAPNVAAGQTVPVALVGTTLHPFNGDPIKLKKGKIRGEVSMGMICAEDELGLGEDHDGILVLDDKWEAGHPVIDTLELEKDWIIEIDLTPNRIDGASHYGVARDLAAFMRKGTQAKLPVLSYDPDAITAPHPVPIEIANTEKCQRFSSIYVSGVNVTDSPEWLQQRLKAIGLRPINNVVDITNYVLMELGKPIHAYDADKLVGPKIIVRTLDHDQPFTLLDGSERTLRAGEDLMVCDAEHPLCVAGTMGGLESGVTNETKNVLIESAYFDPSSVRSTSKALGIQSDSSYRFERGVDPHMTIFSAQRAADLILQLAGGTPTQLRDVKTEEFPPFEITFSLSKANRMYGKEIPAAEQIEILTALEIEVEADKDGDTLYLKVPPYRVDVRRPQDVMEEVLRVHGYNEVAIPPKVNLALEFRQYQDVFRLRQRYADYLSANGFYEILNNSLVSEQLGNEKAVPMLNPLSEDLGILRQSMLPGVLESIRYNQNRQNENLALYEFGKTYQKEESGYGEQEWLVWAVTGNNHPIHWKEKPGPVSVYTLTREVERLLAWFRLTGTWKEYRDDELAYGLEVEVAGKPLVQYGRISGEWMEQYDLRNEVFYARIDWPWLAQNYFQQEITYQEVPVYPAIRRDISMVIPETTSFDSIRSLIQRANPKLIRQIELHDVYQGKGIEAGKKSYLVSIVLRDDHKTLDDKVADKISRKLYHLLENEIRAEIRK